MYEDRIKKAVENFKQGFNCSQSVFLAFADLYGMDRETALRVSSSFGGGIGRMRTICGAASGMFMLAGMETGATDPADRAGKGENYRVVQELAKEFIKRNGSMICGELLGLRDKSDALVSIMDNYKPEARTENYYKKRPCAQMVEEGARIFAEFLEKTRSGKEPIQAGSPE